MALEERIKPEGNWGFAVFSVKGEEIYLHRYGKNPLLVGEVVEGRLAYINTREGKKFLGEVSNHQHDESQESS